MDSSVSQMIYAILSASSFPLLHAWTLIHLNRILHSLFSISCTFSLISSFKYVFARVFQWVQCRSAICMHSYAFKISSASDRLFVHLVSILYIIWTVGWPVLLWPFIPLLPVLTCFHQCRWLLGLLLPVCCLSPWLQSRRLNEANVWELCRGQFVSYCLCESKYFIVFCLFFYFNVNGCISSDDI